MRLLTWILVALLAATAFAQEDPARQIEVFVSSASHLAVFIDHGSGAGIAIGDRLRFFPPGAPSVEGVVRAVTPQNARVELLNSGLFLGVGTRGMAILNSTRSAEDTTEDTGEEEQQEAAAVAAQEASGAADEGQLQRSPVEPLPWSAPLEEWSQDKPLLAPAEVKSARERSLDVHGRFYTNLQARRARVGDWLDSGFVRSGVDVVTTNPFGRGGELRFDGELYGRYAESRFNGSREEVRLRLDRMYYTAGGRREEPTRMQLGRFQQASMPEFGLIDGVDVSRRFGEGTHLGASVGHVPVQVDSWPSQDDYQASVYLRHVSIEERPLDWRVGYQKTWHAGSADRDLVVLDTSYRPTPRDFITGTGWVDLYDPGDGPKDVGPELTRLFATAGHLTAGGSGVRAQYSEFRYPYTRRAEFTPPAEDVLLGDHVQRIGLSAWTRVGSDVRLRARLDRWGDDDDDGYNAEGSCDWARLLPGATDVGVSLFGTRGSFSELAGVRLGASSFRAVGAWNLSWELSRIQESTLVTADENLWQHLVRGSFDTQLFGDWLASITAESGWGDQSQSWTLGLFLQHSF